MRTFKLAFIMQFVFPEIFLSKLLFYFLSNDHGNYLYLRVSDVRKKPELCVLKVIKN